MPFYSIVMQSGVLDDAAKARLAAEITAIHVELSGAPKDWVHVVFQDYAPGSGFRGGEASPVVNLTLVIRSGRTAAYKRDLLTRLWASLRSATGAADDLIEIGIQEVSPDQAMVMGRLMPEVAPDAG
jgi:phenylpyruvate tautomerase PptA (4-oxalocrotonate tautomerase family)